MKALPPQEKEFVSPAASATSAMRARAVAPSSVPTTSAARAPRPILLTMLAPSLLKRGATIRRGRSQGKGGTGLTIDFTPDTGGARRMDGSLPGGIPALTGDPQ